MLAIGIPGLRAQSVVQGFEKEIEGIISRTKDCVVRIKALVPVRDANKGTVIAQGLSVGTGFFIDDQGTILTASSVLNGEDKAMVYWRGKAYEAQCLGQDSRTRVALLKIDAKTPLLPVGDAEMKIGSIALVVGYPYEGQISAEYGFISNPNDVRMPQLFAVTHIRSSARVQPGQSGSPFLNSRGEVVGMVIMATEDGSSTFAIPMAAVRKIQRDFVEYHEARPGWTGLKIEQRSDRLSTADTITISGVYQGQSGHLAGVRVGDILRKIGDRVIRSAADVMNATYYLSVNETVNFTVERKGEILNLPVKIRPRPSDKELLAMKLVESGKP